MIFKHIKGDDPRLLKQAEAFDFSNPPFDPIQFAKDLYETLMSSPYMGIAAPQVDQPYRIFALRTVPGIVCFNPRLVDQSDEEILLDEMCMSFAHLAVPVRRPKKIKVRYYEPNGEVKTSTFDGLTARYFLHELDHLNGIIYTQRANKIHLEKAKRKQKQALRQLKREGTVS